MHEDNLETSLFTLNCHGPQSADKQQWTLKYVCRMYRRFENIYILTQVIVIAHVLKLMSSFFKKKTFNVILRLYIYYALPAVVPIQADGFPTRVFIANRHCGCYGLVLPRRRF